MQFDKGSRQAPEGCEYTDRATGAKIRQLTDHPSINHPTYFLQSSFTPDGKELIFTSYRSGNAQLFEASFPDGEIRQLTDGAAIHPFSPVIRRRACIASAGMARVWNVYTNTAMMSSSCMKHFSAQPETWYLRFGRKSCAAWTGLRAKCGPSLNSMPGTSRPIAPEPWFC